ncbi:MAG: SDR family NAD(P)-dependent oxidoreductase [Elusimicrobia bacterium]|nr:SDR family NAD(P)-dependent oxidoreductase [Candidatus Liberimonas magnetica]
MFIWSGKKVLVTGGAGFIGSHVVEMLVKRGARVLVVDNLENGSMDNLKSVKDEIVFKDFDLNDLDVCVDISKGIDVVMNIAAKVAGIEYNKNNQGEMYFDNVRINSNMLEASRINKVERTLMVSSACVYTRHCKIPTPESEGYRYIPEFTNEGYGWSKRVAEWQSMAYAKEYGMKIAIARPYNAYGPRDHFDPDKSHVIAALIKRIFDNEDPLNVWGDGEQARAFIYVDDFARGLIELTEKYAVADPVNIGTDNEIKIKDLVSLIVKLSGRTPKIQFDTTKPSGQPRRNSDNTNAKQKIGFEAMVKLEDGLKRTIDWYKKANKIV